MTKRARIKALQRWIYVPAGVVLFTAGLIVFPLPIPLGLIMMIMGLFLMAYNPLVLKFLRRMRARFPGVSKKLREVTPHLPGFLARFLKRTESGAQPD